MTQCIEVYGLKVVAAYVFLAGKFIFVPSGDVSFSQKMQRTKNREPEFLRHTIRRALPALVVLRSVIH